MPRTVFDKKNKYERLLSLIRGTADVKDKNFTDIGNMIGRTSDTVTARFKNPENITLGELYRIGRGLDLAIEDIRQCIQY